MIESTHILDTTAVVENNNFEGRVLAAMPAPEEVPPNASEAIDRYLQFGYGFQLLWC